MKPRYKADINNFGRIEVYRKRWYGWQSVYDAKSLEDAKEKMAIFEEYPIYSEGRSESK